MRSYVLRRRFLCVGLFSFILLNRLWSLDLPSAKIEDDSALRRSLLDSWFTEMPGRTLANRSFIHTLSGGGRIQVRIEEGQDEFTIVLARELTASNTGGAEAVRISGAFPGWAQGSWVLTRRRSDGEAIRIRVFLRSDPYTYVQFRPMGDGKCQMDVVLYDAYLVESQPLAITFDRLLVIPVEEALRIAGSSFPRRYFDPDIGRYRDTWNLVTAVRSYLPSFIYGDDGAIDDQGRYVYINTLLPQGEKPGLNCSGFAKWMVDGILRPLTGTLLPIPPLKDAFGDRGSSFTEPYERIRDPYFGLDWIRNLGSRANSALRSASYGTLGEIEVREAPFSQVIIRERDRRGRETRAVKTYPGFLPEAGFGIEGLHPLLYTLAIDEPGRIYLAAVNTEIGAPTTADNLRGRPRMRQYFHIAVLVPYFNEYGTFQVTVFESAAETSSDETSFTFFKNRYPGHYINLVRIPIDSVFDPGGL
ncbi:hypothetical protein FACS189493_0490 [Spirochaetia bacterium]|nr:hypothetical protein FACS189493_0490 [Spirochaetia bacterium]